MRLRKRFKNSGLLVFILLIIILFYSEMLSYYLNSYNWYEMKCSEKKCTKLLLVADPQLIGQQNEVIHFLTPLAIWDSDRYLHITYQQVFNFVKPDVVIFLGDLFDEGSTSSQLEFKSYVKRLYDVFHIEENSSIQYIWLPGDNDIGGEGNDIVTAKKTQKFIQIFPQPDTVQHKHIKFYRINKILHYIPDVTDNNIFFDINIIKIGLSHIPIFTSHSTTFGDEILEKLQPHVLFTAHEHKSKIIQVHFKDRSNRHITATTRKVLKKFEYTLGLDYVYEFLIPTCSYRMGTSNIGYGFAMIENDNLHYTVLWSPTRFPILIIYGFLLLVLSLVLFIKLLKKLIN